MIKLKNVSKFYYKKGIIASGINKVNLEFHLGEFVAITGESGSGKSTVLNVISGLDTYEEGEMYINGMETSHFREKDFEDYRRKYIGNIFQTFNLVNSYTVYQNIELVLLLNGYKRSDVKEKVIELIKKVDLTRFKNTKVSKLSGGQKQRVAIARVLAKETPIIIADEPTGNLDSKSALSIIKLLNEISKDKLVIIVTHNYEQVEDYVTRKIKMHDGKVLEDKVIKKVDNLKLQEENDYKNITIFNQIRLGLRNTFNIIPKFLLLFMVFLFILLALIGEYTGFKEMEYQSDILGYNYLFQDTSPKRIIINKKDRSSLLDNDYKTLNEISNIDYVIKNDYLIDSLVFLTDNDRFYVNGTFQNIDNFEGTLDYGRMPENDSEVIIVGQPYDYYLGQMHEELMKSILYFGNNYNGYVDKSTKIKIVGIKYISNDDYINSNIIYGSSKIEKYINFSINEQFSNVKILFEDRYYISQPYDNYYKLEVNRFVPKGMVYIGEELSMYCPKYKCNNRPLKIEIDNIYYQDSKSLKVGFLYNKNNIKKKLGLNNYSDNAGKVFVNSNDYNNLFNKESFQSSVYVKDVKIINETIKTLNDLGYNTLFIKDTLVKNGVDEIVIILRTIVTIVLIVALFFISYFIIKLIFKSRNIYFSTIRMLGASRGIARNLIVIELFVIANLTYILVLTGVLLTNYQIIRFDILKSMLDYLVFKDYIILYLILIVISCLVSFRYARKLFKNSAMATYREEV